MNGKKRQKIIITILTLLATLLLIMPFYKLVHKLNYDAVHTLEDAPQHTTRACDYIEPSPADGGTLSDEKERFVRHLTEIQRRCEHVELLGKPNIKSSQKSQDLKATSYICLGGKMGLQRRNCLVYSFGIKHPWVKFSELAEKELGCNVRVFEPAVDFIDHQHSTKIRFFNTRLSNIDQQAQYHVPGENGWKYRKFLTIIKEKHLTNKPIDMVRLDVTLDLWKGMSSMLSDGSLHSFVKQLTMEYDMANKNTTEIRQMFYIAQWLNRRGFDLVHSQATTTSSTSYAVTYVNSRIVISSPNVTIDAPEIVTSQTPTIHADGKSD